MPHLLITTSRSTSNRVRSFIRDLWTVHPGSERFNRGSMSLNELVARIGQSGARAAVLVSMSKGNPRTMEFIMPTGSATAKLLLESAVLRRELGPTKTPRIRSVIAVSVKDGSSQHTRAIARFFSEVYNMQVSERSSPMQLGAEGVGQVELWFEDLPTGKVLWTHLHASNAEEIGPRMRIARYEGWN